MDRSLKGRAILVLEDELLAAMDLAYMLRALGATVIGPVGTLEQAEQLAKATALDGAILDVKIDHMTSLELASTLIESGVAVILATGYESNMLPERFAETPRLTKPYSEAMVRKIAFEQFQSTS
jgi:DNA-binding response OmpR family regulator